MGPLFRFLLPLLAVGLANAAQLTLQSPRFTVLSPKGDQLRSEPYALKYGDPLESAHDQYFLRISLAHTPEKPVELGASDSLRLSFSVLEKESGAGVQPHQTFLRFYDETTGEEGIQPIKVGPSGKAKFELNMARPPPSLPPSGDAPLKVTLILGSFVHSPAKYDLFDLRVPPSAPPAQHPDEARFHLLPEIQHTFQAPPKVPMMWVSMTFLWIVLSPWLALLYLWGAVSPRLPHLFSASTFPFTLSLVLLELLIMWYWVELTLGDILLYGSGAAVLAALTGKRALAGIAERRLKNA